MDVPAVLESFDCESLCHESIDSLGEETARFFENSKSEMEQELENMNVVICDLNKMREKAASLEADLLTKINSSTWKEVSELIGMSSSTMINECIKILDLKDEITTDVNE